MRGRVLPHGTTGVVTDPHEIANVAGTDGIDYMLDAAEELLLDVYVMLPSCVPATALDESGAVLDAARLRPYYQHRRVLGLAEVMNAYGTVSADRQVLEKIMDAKSHGKIIDGHAPGISGAVLNRLRDGRCPVGSRMLFRGGSHRKAEAGPVDHDPGGYGGTESAGTDESVPGALLPPLHVCDRR